MMPETGIVVGGIFLMSWYLRHYVGEKAKHLASKEDVAELTREVEAVKSEFRVREDERRAELDRQGRVHQTQLELELRIYRKIWAEVQKVQEAMVVVEVLGGSERPAGDLKVRAATDRFHAARQELEDLQSRWEPFMAPEVQRALIHLTLQMRALVLIATQAVGYESGSEDQWREGFGDLRKSLKTAIRHRLFGAVPTLATEAQVSRPDQAMP
ncbi:MAG: hypothetical protein WEA09_02275 [Gemmatimonadota bacterium]